MKRVFAGNAVEIITGGSMDSINELKPQQVRCPADSPKRQTYQRIKLLLNFEYHVLSLIAA
jgi:hypothetical protein